MRIAICDDNQEELVILNNALIKYSDDNNYNINIISFNDSAQLMAELDNNASYDLFILDIVMPEISGLDIAKYLRSKKINTPIIFLTSSKEFALDAFGVKAADYLVKPLNTKQLLEICDELLNKTNTANTILLSTKDAVQVVDVSHILYCEVISRINYYHINDSTVVKTHTSFKQVLELLGQFDFFYQVHRAFIINFNYVKKIEKNTIFLRNGDEINISREKVKTIKDEYFNYIFKRRNN